MGAMRTIRTSIFELFKVGPGPSSSHTMGPMRAAGMFLAACRRLPPETQARAARLAVRLYGSLAATGRGHATDRAVAAGLLGHEPATCPPDLLSRLDMTPGVLHAVELGEGRAALDPADIVFDELAPVPGMLQVGQDTGGLPGHPNTLEFVLRDANGAELLLRRYASPGGGFVDDGSESAQELGEVPYPYDSMAELRAACDLAGLPLHEVLLRNEEALTGATRAEIDKKLTRIMEVMLDCVQRGLQAEGPLPGPIGLWRKARGIMARSRKRRHQAEKFLLTLSACALAAAEENAAGHVVVTAPTAGAAGVLPAVLYVCKEIKGLPRAALRQGMLAAAAVGLLARHEASISGAEVGCQGEVGVASAMAAAMAAQAHGLPLQAVENAAESALEHHLGLVCDPIGGFVQIPCIERNSMGAVKAYNAFLLATAVPTGHHVVGLDRALLAMLHIGRDMSPDYRETARGGLARQA
ncbi:L-serine dehydratase 1 [Desulfovibrio sp. X2]|uniref:L-serine ammonia-lyase n=1 Tax=Desulfovibrio sp. X2 TaxID=941449 RepID=UPI000358D012|nr:L-serine ammonia-lyase [Desulfovibrio sp. X2]EPR37647.1 L-serine dehydratase 1 [Desulfovibrio sp. X2]